MTEPTLEDRIAEIRRLVKFAEDRLRTFVNVQIDDLKPILDAVDMPCRCTGPNPPQ